MTEYISLGGSCAVAYHLRQHIKEYNRYPFDWCKITIKQLNEVLTNDFKDFCEITVKKFSEVHPFINDELHEADENNVDKEGSYIALNGYKVQFAHQIVQDNMIDKFVYRLGERVVKFKEIKGIENDLVFVRFEVSKLKKDYFKDLEELILNLQRFCGLKKFIFKLIIHISSNVSFDEIIVKYKELLEIYTFEEFEQDWKFPKINWKQILLE